MEPRQIATGYGQRGVGMSKRPKQESAEIMLILMAIVVAVLFAAVGTMGRNSSLVDHADQNVEQLKDGVNGQIN